MSDAHHSNDSPTRSPSLCSIGAFIAEFDRESIVSIAMLLRHKLLPTDTETPCTLSPNPAVGSFNAVWFIDFDDGVQWVFRTPLTEWSPGTVWEKRIQSDIWTMQLIQSRTSVPIPRILDFSVSENNPFGRPYIIMERVKGTPLYDLWFDPNWFSTEKRKKVFRSLASVMSQLQSLEFQQIGSIIYKDGEYTLGPLLPTQSDISCGHTDARGPYNTVHSFLMDTLSHSGLPSEIKASLRIAAGAIPDDRLDGPPFVLSMPDNDFQNIYIDDDGNVTGLLDWDDVFVGPRQAGYNRYPLWLMRDIDINFSQFDFESAALSEIPFPAREEVGQDWPEFLPGYRTEFLEVLNAVDPGSVIPCRYSHLLAPLIREISSDIHWGRITHSLLNYIFYEEDMKAFTLLAPLVFQDGAKRGEWMKQFDNEIDSQ